MTKLIQSQYLDPDRNLAVILTTSHTLIGKLGHIGTESITLSLEDDPEGLILIPWASVLYIMQEGESKAVPHG